MVLLVPLTSVLPSALLISDHGKRSRYTLPLVLSHLLSLPQRQRLRHLDCYECHRGLASHILSQTFDIAFVALGVI